MNAQPKPYVSVEEYLDYERVSPERHEYYRGETFAMAGGSPNHALLAMNLGTGLNNALRGRGCLVFGGDLGVHVTEVDLYTYPDVSVVCGKPSYDGTHLLNPTLLIEVLSPSTEQYDRGRKFEFYRTLRSLREYVLVAQDRPHVEIFRKNDEGRWTLYEFGESGAAEFTSLGCTIPLLEIYANVDFGTAERDRERPSPD